jgi:hypothetical protein
MSHCQNCSKVPYLLWNFWTVLTVCHYLFYCSESLALLVFHFSIGLWNCSDSVAVFVFIWDFGTVPTVWHYLCWYGNNATCSDQFQSHIEKTKCYTLGTFPKSNRKTNDATLSFFFYWTLELIRQCGITGFSMGLLNCSDSVPLFVLLLDFGTVPRVWHYWFFIFQLDFGAVPTVWHY